MNSRLPKSATACQSTVAPTMRKDRGFSLTELLVAVAIVSLSLIGVVYGHIFGLRLAAIVQTKLAAADQARATVGRLTEDVRSAKLIQIGSGTLATFTQVAEGSSQVGNALQIHPTTNLASYVRYYVDTAEQKLKRTTDGLTSTTIAEFVTNSVAFSAESFGGTNLTARQNNRVIGLFLQFYQVPYGTAPVGPNHYYEFYQLQTKITRRTLE